MTKETSVLASVNLDCEDPIKIDTGIGFYDHMLEQIAKHGGFSLQVSCKGDLEVDEHHTVEDTAICIGTAIRQALGDKRGIGRYGFLLPMDESESRVSLDLSGRAYFVFNGEFPRERVGSLPTELVKHFFHTLSDSLGAALHIDVSGANTHHISSNGLSGTLSVVMGETYRYLYFKDGKLLYLSFYYHKDYVLGAYLVASNKLKQTVFDAEMENANRSSRRLKDLLVEDGHVTPQELQDASRYMVEEEFCAMFRADDPQIAFAEGEPDPEIFDTNLNTVKIANPMILSANHSVSITVPSK